MNPALYRMAKAPARIQVKRRQDFPKIEAGPVPELVTVDRSTECHVTPPDVAARMVEYMGHLPGGNLAEIGTPGRGLILEPSAGTGNLSRALVNAGLPASRIVQVERHIKLAEGLREFGSVANSCFLEYAQHNAAARVTFSGVIMNPPFSDVRKHVKAARSLLAKGGTLVALVPVTFETDSMETLEQLADDTFSTAKVRTKIIRIYG